MSITITLSSTMPSHGLCAAEGWRTRRAVPYYRVSPLVAAPTFETAAMPKSASTAWLHSVLFGACLAVAGCHPAPSPEIDPDRGDSRTSDSLHAAQAERNRSSATQSIDFTAEDRGKFTRVEQMIQARFSGVQVEPSGGGYSIRIRGSSSLGTSRNEPLIIIDGASRSPGDLGVISPREVQRIEVMKDGAASIYGSRGSNGVIRVTTIRASP